MFFLFFSAFFSSNSPIFWPFYAPFLAPLFVIVSSSCITPTDTSTDKKGPRPSHPSHSTHATLLASHSPESHPPLSPALTPSASSAPSPQLRFDTSPVTSADASLAGEPTAVSASQKGTTGSKKISFFSLSSLLGLGLPHAPTSKLKNDPSFVKPAIPLAPLKDPQLLSPPLNNKQKDDPANLSTSPQKVLLSDLEGKTILHCGDSMVGGQEALTKALEKKFKEQKVKRFVSRTTVSANLATFRYKPHFAETLKQTNPDIVILTLGANDVFAPFPEALATHVQSIVHRMAGKECYWIGPPTWKPDTGVVEVIKNNVAPCLFYDSRNLALSRAHDHIHPNNEGGALWADLFWSEFKELHQKYIESLEQKNTLSSSP